MDLDGGGGGNNTMLIVVACCCCCSMAIGLFLFFAYYKQESFPWLDWLWKLLRLKKDSGDGDTGGGDPGSGGDPVGDPFGTDTPLPATIGDPLPADPIPNPGKPNPQPSDPNPGKPAKNKKCKAAEKGSCASAEACKNKCIKVGSNKYAKSVKKNKCWTWQTGFKDNKCKKRRSNFEAWMPATAPLPCNEY